MVSTRSSFKQLLRTVKEGTVEKGKSEKLSRMMELNPLIGNALVEKLYSTKDRGVCVELLRLLRLSKNSVNFASRLVMMKVLKGDDVLSFVQEGLKELLDRHVDSTTLAALCFFIIGAVDRKLVESSVGACGSA